jgi:hypothetical protein
MRKIAALEATERPYAVWDGALPCLGVHVAASGRKTFIAQTRIRGVSRRTTLGQYPHCHIDAMRAAARLWLLNAEKRQRPPQPKPAAPPPVSLRELGAEYCANQSLRWAPKTQALSELSLDRFIYPVLGDLDVAKLRTADVERWFDGMAKTPANANRSAPVFSLVRRYAEQKGLRPVGSNPCRCLKLYKRRPKKRFLSTTELQRLGRHISGLEAEQPAFAAAIRLLALTGMRASEVLSLPFGDVQGARAFLRASKAGPRTVYLCAAARQIIEAGKVAGAGDWIISETQRQ